MTEHTDLNWLKSNSPESRVAGRKRRPALGSDPFGQGSESDPFLDGLGQLQGLADLNDIGDLRGLRGTETAVAVDAIPTEKVEIRSKVRSKKSRPTRKAQSAEKPEPEQIKVREEVRSRQTDWVDVPKLEDVELPDRTSWADRLLTDDERRRVAAVAHISGAETPYDRHGFSAEVLRNALPVFAALYKVYFRVESSGQQNIPVRGPAILAGNHAGVLPFDAAMVATDLLLKCDPPRLGRTIVDRWAGSLPWINILYSRGGQVIGTRENFSDLLRNGNVVIVLPEGMKGAVKPISERYQLQKFNVGFIEHALEHGVPIVPTAVVGSDDQMPVLFDLGPIVRRFGMPNLPITPTFPWLGPLGILPYPVRYRIRYGEPLDFSERYGPEDARDPDLVRFLSRQVRRAVQRLIDQNR
jgi:1-acyl-sn-glycerol-3-phosphate acyltransferase